MNKIYFFGVGNIDSLKEEKTHFLIRNNTQEFFLVNAGGDNTVIRELPQHKLQLNDIHHLLVTSKSLQHVTGVIHFLQNVIIASLEHKYDGELLLYCDHEIQKVISTLCATMFEDDLFVRFFDKCIRFVEISDNYQITLGDMKLTFHYFGTEYRNWGFTLETSEHKKVFFTGSECYCEQFNPIIQNMDIIIQSASSEDTDNSKESTKQLLDWLSYVSANKIFLVYRDDNIDYNTIKNQSSQELILPISGNEYYL